MLITSPMQLLKKLLRRHEERILLKNAADDDHRLGPHDIYHGVAAELSKIVDADNGVIVTAPDVVNPRLERDQIVNAGRMPAGPFHLTNDTAERVWPIDRAARDEFERLKHAILIESAVAEIGVGVDVKL